MAHVFNFSAGCGPLPAEVSAEAQRALGDWQGQGISLLEVPFTSSDFKSIHRRAQDRLRALLGIPQNYRILFLQGGASAQFSLIPLNLLGSQRRADYLETGHWSRRAITEGRRYGLINVAGSSRGSGFARIPPQEQLQLYSKAAYCHYTTNETANGVQFHYLPEVGMVPLVANMTSDFLTRPLDVGRYGVIYASAQKNIGAAGLTVVIVREDLLGRAHPVTPMVFDYRMQSDADSLLNTPSTFAIFIADLMFAWLEVQGGVAAMEKRGLERSRQLYQAIDASNGFYHGLADPEHRSRVSVCFTLADAALIPIFLEQAGRVGLANLQGHSMLGGIRASLYNAMPDEGVAALAAFMRDFAEAHRDV